MQKTSEEKELKIETPYTRQKELGKHIYSKLQSYYVYDLDNFHWAFSHFHQVWFFPFQFAER
jgi:hypothetical protein